MVIFNNIFEEISYYTRLDVSQIRSFIYTDNEEYREYYKKVRIPKKRLGEYRELHVPSPEVKLVQHYLCDKYFLNLNVHSAATAYIKGKSILDNVIKHSGNKSFLFLDVTDFFNSIDFEILYEIILNQKNNKLSSDNLRFALMLCSYKKEFVQGCVTSPILSNIYMYYFDEKISQLVKQLNNGVYTRYSDDITISSKDKIPSEFINVVERYLIELKLSLNKKKCHYSSYIDNVIVTGLRIKKDGTVSLNTEFKKNLKNKMYHALKNPNVDISIIEQLLGLMSYLKMIDSYYYNVINLKYSDGNSLAIDRLKRIANKRKQQNG